MQCLWAAASSMYKCVQAEMEFQLEFLSWFPQLGQDINIKIVFQAVRHEPNDYRFRLYRSKTKSQWCMVNT